MATDSSDSGASHAHIKTKDKDRVEDNVDNGANESDGHRTIRRAIGANDRTKCIADHVNWEGGDNNCVIFEREGQGLVGSAEKAENLIMENETNGSKNERGAEGGDKSVSNRFVKIVGGLFALFDAHERSDAVTEAPRNRASGHSDWENNRSGGVAEVTEVGMIADKDLVNDVIECADN